MTLEDFFTLTEIKDGLLALSRIEELVNVVKKDQDSTVKNIGEATRQWTAVASVIAATKNKDCLDLFIRLDGIHCIDKWLKNAQEYSNDSTASYIEDSIVALLQALGNLHTDNRGALPSSTWLTVKNLLGHRSSQVQNTARGLLDSWKQENISDLVPNVADSVGCNHDNGTGVNTMSIVEGSKGEISEPSLKEDKGAEYVPEAENVLEAKNAPLINLADHKSGRGEDLSIEIRRSETDSSISMTNPDTEDKAADDNVLPSNVTNDIQDSVFLKEKCLLGSPVDTSFAQTSSSSHLKQCSSGRPSHAPKLNDIPKDEKPVYKSDTAAVPASCSVELVAVVTEAGGSSGQEVNTKPILLKNSDASGSRTPISERKGLMVEMGDINNCSKVGSTTSQARDVRSHSDTSLGSVGEDQKQGKAKDLDTSFHQKDNIEANKEEKSSAKRGEGLKLRKGSRFDKSTHVRDMIHSKTTDMDLEYGIVDALEVARMVAQEVEREVGDYHDQSCSSSEKISAGIGLPATPDSAGDKSDESVGALPKEVPATENQYADGNSEEKHVMDSSNMSMEQGAGANDLETSMVTEAAQEPEGNKDRSLCDFDLNQEVCSADVDQPVNSISTPTPAAPVSWMAPPPGLPVQFEGTLGWRGSAATSAFHAASPRRLFDSDRALSIGGNGRSSEQSQRFLDIDLNVADDEDSRPVNLMSRKQIPIMSGIHSAESSLEMSPKRSEMLKLDLNSAGDGYDTPLLGQLLGNLNGNRSPSPASSSSSMWHTKRNFDLNDRPLLHTDTDQRPTYELFSRSMDGNRVPTPEEPVFSIMGAKVSLGRKEFLPPTPCLPRENSIEPGVDASLARGSSLGLGPTFPYTHSPVYGYNGMSIAPNLSFSSSLYGPGGSIPYMVDSRGTPVMPQILGSSSAMPSVYSQSPFMMSMTGVPPGLNCSGPAQPNFDLSMNGAPPGFNGSVSARPSFDLSMNNTTHPRYNGSGPSRTSLDLSINTAHPGFNSSVTARPNFDLTMSAPSGLNGLVPPRPSFDLNSGFAYEGMNRESMMSRQLFMSSQGRSGEDQSRNNPQSSSSSGGKRKEPDSKWEPYPYNLKHQQPPWR